MACSQDVEIVSRESHDPWNGTEEEGGEVMETQSNIALSPFLHTWERGEAVDRGEEDRSGLRGLAFHGP